MILDPDGKVVHRGTDPKKGSYYYQGEGNPPVPFVDLKKALEAHKDKGLLGGLDVPARLAPITVALKQGQLAKAQNLLARVPARDAYASFKAELIKRLQALAAAKAEQLEGLLAEGKSWDAYKVGASYLRCFPDAQGAAGVREKMNALRANAEVKRQVAARDSYRRAAAACCGPRQVIKNPAQVKAVFAKLARQHDGTEYGGAMQVLADQELPATASK